MIEANIFDDVIETTQRHTSAIWLPKKRLFCKDGFGLELCLPADVICEFASIVHLFGMPNMKAGNFTSKDGCIISLPLWDLEFNILLNSLQTTSAL